MKIAALYTCFNRKEKTLASIGSLFTSLAYYNEGVPDQIELTVFLTDDGCTDGTADAINNKFPKQQITILQGDGSLFWAGGMRKAWKEALKRHEEWNYYLLLNDDTILYQECFDELLSSQKYCKEKYGKCGIISGITCSSTNPDIITYGGDIIVNRFTGRLQRLGKSDKPQKVDITNANILLVPKNVVDQIGIFYDGFVHGTADVDYSMWANRHGIPVLITAGISGICDNDHPATISDKQRIINMTFQERKAYYRHPLHSDKDYLTFVKRNIPVRYPLSWLFSKFRLVFPKFYFSIHG